MYVGMINKSINLSLSLYIYIYIYILYICIAIARLGRGSAPPLDNSSNTSTGNNVCSTSSTSA